MLHGAELTETIISCFVIKGSKDIWALLLVKITVSTTKMIM
jgi:hypothetical protein